MPKYQIRFVDREGNGSFEYVDCSKEKAPEMAAKKATEYINKRKEMSGIRWPHTPFKPKRIVNVWEWDTKIGEPKRKGHRFKLELMFFQATYNSGRKVRDEWYEPIEK